MGNPTEDVFICYSRSTGAELAQLFRARLERGGVSVFLDVEASYWGPFPKELSERVARTPFFLVLLTAGCIESDWMGHEVAQALRSQRKIIVVRTLELELPEAEDLSWPWADLLLLNHISYAHEFADEAVRRVLKQLKRDRKRARLLSTLGAAAACTLAAAASFGYHRFTFESGRAATAAHPVAAGGSGAILPDAVSSSRPSRVAPALTEAARPAVRYVLVVDADPPEATVRVGDVVAISAQEIAVGSDLQQPVEVRVEKPGYVTSARQITRSDFMESGGAWRARISVVLHRRQPEQAAKPAKTFERWCYWRSGYDPMIGDARRECASFSSFEQCRTNAKVVLAAGSIWTRAEECSRCNCKGK